MAFEIKEGYAIISAVPSEVDKDRQPGDRSSKNISLAGTVTVSGKESLDIPPGTLNSILKQAGLK